MATLMRHRMPLWIGLAALAAIGDALLVSWQLGMGRLAIVCGIASAFVIGWFAWTWRPLTK